MEQQNHTPLVSIIVPVCNVERYLGQCMDALVGQTLRDIEVIALDDGSTDSSPQILKRYAQADARVHVICKPNEGYGATVNRGLDEARGAYIGIVEPDDYPEPDMFERLTAAARRLDADLVKCDFLDMFEHGEHPRRNLAGLPYGVPFDPADHPQAVLVMPSIWSAVYRAGFLREHGVRCRETPGAAFQDTAFGLQCLTEARRCVMIPAPLMHYRRDNPNSSVVSTDKVFTVADEFAEARRRLAADPARYGAFIRHMRLDEWETHRWDCERIAPEARGAYFERVRAEFAKAAEAGEVDRSVFGPARLERLQALLACEDADLQRFDPREEASPRAHVPVKVRAASTKVSVVVPAHDAQETVGRAVGSCLAQTHGNVEVVCVDDASTDGTLAELQALARADGRVKVVALGDNRLTHNARLAGVGAATGAVVTFLDADDELEPRACALMAREFARQPYDILQFSTRVCADGAADAAQVESLERWCRAARGEKRGRDILAHAFVDFSYSASIWGKAYRADLARLAFEGLGAVEADYGEDLMEYFAMAQRAESFRGRPGERLYVYHYGDGLSSNARMDARAFERPLRGLRALEGLHAYLDRAGMLPELAGVFHVHALEQVNALYRTFNDMVEESAKPACLPRVQAFERGAAALCGEA